jgi:predicted transcriptional regulator
MNQWERTLYSVVNEERELATAVQEAFDELNVSVPEFCRDSGLSESTVYKILSGHRENIQLENFQEIVLTLKRLEQGRSVNERVVAIITNREALEQVKDHIELQEYQVSLEGYPCSTVEEAIRQGIIAERDGVDAIICGPITAYTIENIIHTPVIGLDIRAEQIREAVETVVHRTA